MNGYRVIQIPLDAPLNRILDNEARELYKPAIDKLFQLVPKAMLRKIPEANVQQGFVFDTVQRYISQYRNPYILCVGSYEDTASMGLIAMGFVITEIDPIFNYSLLEYSAKMPEMRNSYNIIFSTSVIEHVQDDGTFLAQISDLLAPGGVAILTCDYKDGWRTGDAKPDVDERLYTQYDLKERLLLLMSDCVLVDEPQWDCPNPDFILADLYRYTFATFVVRKINRG